MVSRAKDTHTTNRVVRIDDELWAEFGELCEEEGTNRTADIRAYIERRLKARRRRAKREAQS